MMFEIDGVDIVVITKIDRMARSLIDLLNTIQILEKKGIGFISLQDSGIDTTSPNGKLLLQILGTFAEF
jgi:DNA invertase Pin-like site-specific DNA recombinase